MSYRPTSHKAFDFDNVLTVKQIAQSFSKLPLIKEMNAKVHLGNLGVAQSDNKHKKRLYFSNWHILYVTDVV
jgi:hypothetical protein